VKTIKYLIVSKRFVVVRVRVRARMKWVTILKWILMMFMKNQVVVVVVAP
jgi:hypothetical protein